MKRSPYTDEGYLDVKCPYCGNDLPFFDEKMRPGIYGCSYCGEHFNFDGKSAEKIEKGDDCNG